MFQFTQEASLLHKALLFAGRIELSAQNFNRDKWFIIENIMLPLINDARGTGTDLLEEAIVPDLQSIIALPIDIHIQVLDQRFSPAGDMDVCLISINMHARACGVRSISACVWGECHKVA